MFANGWYIFYHVLRKLEQVFGFWCQFSTLWFFHVEKLVLYKILLNLLKLLKELTRPTHQQSQNI